MPTATHLHLAPPLHHVFVDFENVHKVDLTIIGSKAVTFTLLVGGKQSKLDVSLVEKLFEHAVSVQFVRLSSSGRNALDFTLAYYVGRAVAADPTGHFYIMSKDTGYDPLIAHLRSRHISAHRHESFATLPFVGRPATTNPAPAAPTPSAATAATARKAKPQSQPQPQSKWPTSVLKQWETRVLDYLCKSPRHRPRTETKLLSLVITHLGHNISEAEAQQIGRA